VTVVGNNRAVVFCLLATSAILLSGKEKRNSKMRSEKWNLERDISCGGRLRVLRWCYDGVGR
jgi:hypothetical protein